MLKRFYSDDKQSWILVDTEKGYVTEIGSDEGYWNGKTSREDRMFAYCLLDAIGTLTPKTRNNLKKFCNNDSVLKSIYVKEHDRLQKETIEWEW